MIVQGLVSNSYKGSYTASNTETVRPFVSNAPGIVKPIYPFKRSMPEIVIRNSRKLRSNPSKFELLFPKLAAMIKGNPNILKTIDTRLTQFFMGKQPFVPYGGVSGGSPKVVKPLPPPPGGGPSLPPPPGGGPSLPPPPGGGPLSDSSSDTTPGDIYNWIMSLIPSNADVTDAELEQELQEIIDNLTITPTNSESTLVGTPVSTVPGVGVGTSPLGIDIGVGTSPLGIDIGVGTSPIATARPPTNDVSVGTEPTWSELTQVYTDFMDRYRARPPPPINTNVPRVSSESRRRVRERMGPDFRMDWDIPQRRSTRRK